MSYFPKILALFLVLVIGILSCKDDPISPTPTNNPITPSQNSPKDLTSIAYNPAPVAIEKLENFPNMDIPADNPLTAEGIELGKHLFFDPILSANQQMACANCHLPSSAFTDNLPVSTGIDEIAGIRSSMALFNVGYYTKGLFWDGSVVSLEEQALLPVEDPIELHHNWEDVIKDLQQHTTYPTLFRKAFGIDNTSEINKEIAAKAIAQFERSIVSGQSKYDRVVRGEEFFEDEEFNLSLIHI